MRLTKSVSQIHQYTMKKGVLPHHQVAMKYVNDFEGISLQYYLTNLLKRYGFDAIFKNEIFNIYTKFIAKSIFN